MDIKQTARFENSSVPAGSSSQPAALLELKLNQQLAVKVISSELKSQSILLESDSNKRFQVKSNQPIHTKEGQTLNIMVTKLTPAAEFKVLDKTASADANATIILKSSPVSVTSDTSATKNVAALAVNLITAKIIAIDKDNVQLKLFTSPSAAYNSNSDKAQNSLQQDNPVITLKKAQLLFAESRLNQTEKNLAESTDYQAGQRLQLDIKKLALDPALSNIKNLKLSKGQVISARIVGLENNQIQLGLLKDLSSNNEFNQKTVISITENQLSLLPTNKSQQSTISALNIHQQLRLEVQKANDPAVFKIVEQDSALTTKRL